MSYVPPKRQVANSAATVYRSDGIQSSTTSWVEIITSTPEAILITSVLVGANVASGSLISAIIGTGTVGNEIEIARFPVPYMGGNYCPSTHSLTYPIRVPAGTRIVVKNSITSGIPIAISYVYESALA